jgi:hypothetical protein
MNHADAKPPTTSPPPNSRQFAEFALTEAIFSSKKPVVTVRHKTAEFGRPVANRETPEKPEKRLKKAPKKPKKKLDAHTQQIAEFG